jgi:hypothetical protein
MKKILMSCLFLASITNLYSQVLTESGTLMGWVQDHIANRIPQANSEGFAVPTTSQLEQWRDVMDLLLTGQSAAAADSLSLHFPNYRISVFTDTLFSDFQYLMVRESYPVQYGWGTFIVFPQYQRDITVAVPHPIYDDNTPYEGIDLFQYTGARFFVMAGTHRCANAAFSGCSGTTGACNNGVQQSFRISDMAHNTETPFQKAHEAMLALSAHAWFFNLHGHNDNDCADIFLSNGRADDVKASMQGLRDSLVARGIDAKHTEDGTSCPLTGTTNAQGRLVNGSATPCTTSNVSNTGRFFHIEQSPEIRREQVAYRAMIDEIAEMIPRAFNTIVLPQFTDIVLNEFLPWPRNPYGDANGNGSVNGNTDEFLEFVNNSSFTIDMSRWSMSDFRKVRHVFPSGTVLIPGQAVVVFGPAAPVGSFGGTLVQQSSTDSLSLANSSDTIILKNASGATLWRISYSNSDTSIAKVRWPELTGAFVAHTTTPSGARFSPGTKAHGSAFLPNAKVINAAGWRMLASPASGFSVKLLSDQTAIQGIGNGHAKNLYNGYNGSNWTAPSGMSSMLENGRGFIVYFYNNMAAGSKNLPLTLFAPGDFPTTDVEVSLHSTGDKFNFLGNPFETAFDWTVLQANGGTLASSVGQVWDPAAGHYVTTTALGNVLASWQGVMIENSSASSVTFPLSGKTNGGTLLAGKRNQATGNALIAVEVVSEADRVLDAVYLVSSDDVRLHARKMPLLETQGAGISLVVNEHKMAQVSVPESLTNEMHIPLLLSSTTGNSTIRTRLISKNAPDWNLSLKHLPTGKSTPLSSVPQPVTVSHVQGVSIDSSYALVVNPVEASSVPEHRPDAFRIIGVYPNPFNPETVISFSVPEMQEISVRVFSITGQEVYTHGVHAFAQGEQKISLQASGWASGVYLVLLESRSGRLITKITLLK